MKNFFRALVFLLVGSTSVCFGQALSSTIMCSTDSDEISNDVSTNQEMTFAGTHSISLSQTQYITLPETDAVKPFLYKREYLLVSPNLATKVTDLLKSVYPGTDFIPHDWVAVKIEGASVACQKRYRFKVPASVAVSRDGYSLTATASGNIRLDALKNNWDIKFINQHDSQKTLKFTLKQKNLDA